MSAEIITIFAIGLAVFVAGGVALLGLANVFASSDGVSERLDTYALIPEETVRRTRDRRRAGMLRLRLRMNSLFSGFSSEQLHMRLLSANWPITEMEFFLIRVGGMLLGLGLGWLFFQSFLAGVGIAILAFLVPDMYLRRSVRKRRSKFANQLVDVLVLVQGAVRAGYSFLQALDVVVDEMAAPASEEFGRVRREVGLGLPLSQALENLQERMQNEDLLLVVTAVIINTQVGGNLATMLDAVTVTIRERVRLFAEIRALTSMQRWSGYILSLLPFIVAAVLFMMSPEYMGRLFEPGITLCIPIGAVIFIILGNISMRMISRIDV
ncbi:MAG: type II secretion system F family protein [Anaerolineales bacterium]|nr:type II secretion system F family protein [Anaerolineales bacterium]MCK5430846.1 type II secretion system F family protein [Anaerolineales bacterium]